MKEVKVRFDDQIAVMMCSALGIKHGEMLIPKKMEEGLIKAYMESGAVKSTCLFIKHKGDKKWKEITDGVNYNTYGGL